MNQEAVIRFMEVCQNARSVFKYFPDLPDGLTSRHIRVVGVIGDLMGKDVRISDIADALSSTRPSITKLVNELDEKDYLEKLPYDQDHRITHVVLTAKGQAAYERFISAYHEKVAQAFSQKYSEQEIIEAAKVMNGAISIIKTLKEGE